MADGTHIEWTDATWNPITGCSIVSPGCARCYAMKLAGTRLQHHPSRVGLTADSKTGPVWTGEVRLNENWLDQPLRWKRPRRIFVCAHGDLFAENVPDAWIDKVFAVMALARQHTFQVLTKRANRMRQYLASASADQVRDRWYRSVPAGEWYVSVAEAYAGIHPHASEETRALYHKPQPVWPLPNVWLGVSAERRQEWLHRTMHLRCTPAATRFVSVEPLLGDLGHLNLDGIDQVIVGGESGDGARPMHPAWVREIEEQCAQSGTAFFFKQWGNWKPISQMKDGEADDLYHPAPLRYPEAIRRCKVSSTVLHADGSHYDDPADSKAYAAGSGAMLMFEVGKGKAGRQLDGVEHNGMPEIAEVPFQ